jgi:hypothetical protein
MILNCRSGSKENTTGLETPNLFRMISNKMTLIFVRRRVTGFGFLSNELIFKRKGSRRSLV